MWVPVFKLIDGPVARVMVMLRPKMSASEDMISEWQKNGTSLPAVWFKSILLPAVKCLPDHSRTRRFNAVDTIESTQLLPMY